MQREMFYRAPCRLRLGDLQTSLEISDHPEAQIWVDCWCYHMHVCTVKRRLRLAAC